MGNITIKLPESLHAAVRELARKENVSINQIITLALAEKISVLITEEYLEDRAAKGDRTRFERAMSKVPDLEPDEYDRL